MNYHTMGELRTKLRYYYDHHINDGWGIRHDLESLGIDFSDPSVQEVVRVTLFDIYQKMQTEANYRDLGHLFIFLMKHCQAPDSTKLVFCCEEFSLADNIEGINKIVEIGLPSNLFCPKVITRCQMTLVDYIETAKDKSEDKEVVPYLWVFTDLDALGWINEQSVQEYVRSYIENHLQRFLKKSATTPMHALRSFVKTFKSKLIGGAPPDGLFHRAMEKATKELR